VPSRTDLLISGTAEGQATVQGARDELRERFKASPARGRVTVVKHFPARDARLTPFREGLAPRLAGILRSPAA
jgi:hypothetical protein